MFKNIKLNLHHYAKHLRPNILVTLGVSSIVVLITVCLILPVPEYSEGFQTLSELEGYSRKFPENIEIENTYAINPVYDKFYSNKYASTKLSKIFNQFKYVLYKLGITNPPPMSCNVFNLLLSDNIKNREHYGRDGFFIESLTLEEKSKVVVFGPTQGTFHAFIRYLKKIKELKIISDDLKITQPGYFIVFLGNVVNRSPYTIELFTIILKLLKENPKNVFYLRGTHEQENIWKNQTLGKEIEYLFEEKTKSIKDLIEAQINLFFNTLPITIFFKTPAENLKSADFFQISPHIEDDSINKKINSIQYSSFLRESCLQSYCYFDLDKIIPNQLTYQTISPVKAIITGIKKRDLYEDMDGLRLVSHSDGIITWTTLSTASQIYQMGLGYFYEAFTIIELSNNSWSITLYNRNIKSDSLNFRTRKQNFFTGENIT